MTKAAWRPVLLLSTAGLGLSTYLTAVSYSRADLSYCSPTAFISCDAVIYSQYAQVLGVPVALIGLAGFVALFVIAYLGLVSGSTLQRRLWMAVTILSSLGLLFGIYLTYLEIFVIGSVCLLCLATFSLILPVVPLAITALRSGEGKALAA